MGEWILIRHGATAGNLERRYIGHTDEPLCPQGREQALWLGRQGFQVDTLLVSPALRAIQTAQLAFPGMEYTVVPDLMETNFGAFEGKTAQEMTDDPAYRAWVDSGCQGAVPGGESAADFKARCCAAFVRVAAQLPVDSRAAWVVHGGVIMAILEAYAKPARGFYDYHIGNGGFFRCTCKQNEIFVESSAAPK